MKLIRQDDEEKLLFWLIYHVLSLLSLIECVCYKVNLYILRGFRKLVMISKNVKNAPNLIRKSSFLKNKRG